MTSSDRPVRANLSTGTITCLVRTADPLPPSAWEIVQQLAEAVDKANHELTLKGSGL
jgi:hypothetical protein